MSMHTLTWDVDAAAFAGNSDAYYSLALATQARQKSVILPRHPFQQTKKQKNFFHSLNEAVTLYCIILAYFKLNISSTCWNTSWNSPCAGRRSLKVLNPLLGLLLRHYIHSQGSGKRVVGSREVLINVAQMVLIRARQNFLKERNSWTLVIQPSVTYPDISVIRPWSCSVYCLFFIHFHIASCSKEKING